MLKQSFRRSKTDLILLGLYLLPIVIVLVFITKFGVNVPAYDQWVLPRVFEKVATHQLNFSDLFELHNTHRILFPRLIFIGLAFLSGWNIKLEMLFSLGLAVLTFIALYILAYITSSPRERNLFHFANLLTCCLIFSLNQEWLWGFQLPIFLINFCLIIACLILSLKAFSTKTKLTLAAICCGVASFSSLQGLITWLALIPLILSQDQSQISQKKQCLIWLTGFLISAVIYAINYQQEPRIINLSFPEYVLTSIQFFLNVLAAPLIQLPILSSFIGLIILALLIRILVYFFQSYSLNNQRLNPYAPGLSMALFSLLTSLLMTLGRVEFGGNYPLTATRYTTHNLLLIIALVYLYKVFIFEHRKTRKISTNNSLLIYGFCGGIIFSLIVVSSQIALNQARLEFPYRTSSKTCLNLFYYLEDSEFFNTSPERCLLPMSKSTWWIRDGVESLDQIQMRSFAKNIPFVREPERVYGYIDRPSTAVNIQNNQILNLAGWAVLPDQTQQPRLVFLSFDEQQSFFAQGDITKESPDIAEFLHSSRYHLARWEVRLPAESLPIGETEISAWVYDPLHQQFVRLQGPVKINIATE